jgi:hypothetical protein
MTILNLKLAVFVFTLGLILVVGGFFGKNMNLGYIGIGIAAFSVVLAFFARRSTEAELPTQRAPKTIAEALIPTLDEVLAKVNVSANLKAVIPVDQTFNYKGQDGKLKGELVVDINNQVSKEIALPKPQETPKPETPKEPVILERSVRD